MDERYLSGADKKAAKNLPSKNCSANNKRLGKHERLEKPYQFRNVYSQRSVVRGRTIWCYRAPNGLSHNRLGVSISKKKCHNLVMRNKIKRLIKEVFRLNKQRFGVGVDIVFTLKSFPGDLRYCAVENEILNLM